MIFKWLWCEIPPEVIWVHSLDKPHPPLQSVGLIFPSQHLRMFTFQSWRSSKPVFHLCSNCASQWPNGEMPRRQTPAYSQGWENIQRNVNRRLNKLSLAKMLQMLTVATPIPTPPPLPGSLGDFLTLGPPAKSQGKWRACCLQFHLSHGSACLTALHFPQRPSSLSL